MNRERIEGFLGWIVAVGVPHYYDENKLFYLFGKLTDVNDEEITLVMEDEVKQVRLDEIKHIHIAKEVLD